MSDLPENLPRRFREICLREGRRISERLRRQHIDAWLADGTLTVDPDLTDPDLTQKKDNVKLEKCCGEESEPRDKPVNHVSNKPAPSLPSAFQQAKNLATAAAKHAASGFQKSSPEIWNARVDACRQCPLYRPEDKRCSECGCYVELKAKMLTQDCPHPDGSRWPNLLEFLKENPKNNPEENPEP